MQYYVVEFDDGVQVVPDNWIMGDRCFWPPLFKSNVRFEKAVKNFEQPNTETWTLHKYSTLGIYSSYDLARAKLKTAEQKTDIEASTDSEQARKKRKFKKRIVFESSGSSDEASTTIIKKFPSPPVHNSSTSSIMFDRIITPSSSVHKKNQVLCNTSTPATSETSASTKTSLEIPAPQVSHQKEDFQHKVLRELVSIKMNIAKLLELYNSKNCKCHNGTNDVVDDVLDAFPIDNDVKLEDIENSVSTNVEFKSRLISRLSLVGGVKEDEVVKGILKRLMTDAVASTYSWAAGKGKKNFSNLQLSQIIIKAAQSHNGLFKDVTIINSIRNWLRHAPARLANKGNKNKGTLNATV